MVLESVTHHAQLARLGHIEHASGQIKCRHIEGQRCVRDGWLLRLRLRLLLHQRVVSPDDLQVELGADPHGVGVHQLFADEGANTLACLNSRNSVFFQLGGQIFGLLQLLPVGRAVLTFFTCRLVQVVEAVAPLGILADTDASNGQGCHVGGGLGKQ